MVIWVQCITLKLTFLHKELYSSRDHFHCFISEDSREIYRPRKIVNFDKN